MKVMDCGQTEHVQTCCVQTYGTLHYEGKVQSSQVSFGLSHLDTCCCCRRVVVHCDDVLYETLCLESTFDNDDDDDSLFRVVVGNSMPLQFTTQNERQHTHTLLY